VKCKHVSACCRCSIHFAKFKGIGDAPEPLGGEAFYSRCFLVFFRILICQELYLYTHLGVQIEIQRKRRSNLLLAEGFALPPMGEEHFKKTLYSVYIVKYSSDETHTIYKINTNTYIAGFQNNTEHYTVTDVKRIRQYDSQRNTWYCALCVMLKTRNV